MLKAFSVTPISSHLFCSRVLVVMYSHYLRPMELYVKTLTGVTLEVLVAPSDTVFDVKCRIQKLEGIPVSQQHLIWQSEEMEDMRSLRDYHIQNGATLQLVLAMRGGPVNTRRVPVEDSTLNEMTEYFCDASRDDLSPSDHHHLPVTFIVCHNGDQLNFYRLIDRDPTSSLGASESNLREDSPIPTERREENDRTREKMKLLKSQMQNLNLVKGHKDKDTNKVVHRRQTSSRPVSRLRLRNTQQPIAGQGQGQGDAVVLNKNRLLPPIGQSNVDSAKSDVSDQNAARCDEMAYIAEISKPGGSVVACPERPSSLTSIDRHLPLVHSDELSSDPQSSLIPLDLQPCSARNTNQVQASKADSAEIESAVNADDVGNEIEKSEVTEVTIRRRDEVLVLPPPPPHDDRWLLSAAGVVSQTLSSAASMLPSTHSSQLEVESRVSAASDRPQTGSQSVVTKPAEGQQPDTSASFASAALLSSSTDVSNVSTGNNNSNRIATNTTTTSTTGSSTAADIVALASVLGLPPSPPRRAVGPRSGIALQSLNMLEVRAMSGMLNTIVRNHSYLDRLSASPVGSAKKVHDQPAGLSLTPRVKSSSQRKSSNVLSSTIRAGSSTSGRIPSVKVSSVRKKSAKKRCAVCGKKTRLAMSFQCRCGGNFCTVHRYAEAHACTFDYRSEGRKLLEQNNPVVTAPKLPKI